jgi:class 3 adenylate cyclase
MAHFGMPVSVLDGWVRVGRIVVCVRGDLPSGTVTFLFTDVEGSTRLWAADSDAMSRSLRVHDQILRDAVADHQGYVFTTAGDAFCVAWSCVAGADGLAFG